LGVVSVDDGRIGVADLARHILALRRGVESAFTLNDRKFIGKERDAESGLDNFDARYYVSSLGRWLTPDWSNTPEPVPYANLSNPQTLNLYAMVQDNPESFADLTGHGDPTSTGGQDGSKCRLNGGNDCGELIDSYLFFIGTTNSPQPPSAACQLSLAPTLKARLMKRHWKNFPQPSMV
jgi:RHS repeat-associated protein